MRNPDLAADDIQRAGIRLRALDVLYDAESWADVVREAQEIVELALRALLRACGIEAPRIHDVSDVLLSERTWRPPVLDGEVEALAEVSRQLRRDRELAFYGRRGPHAVGLLLAQRCGAREKGCATHRGARGAARPGPRMRRLPALQLPRHPVQPERRAAAHHRGGPGNLGHPAVGGRRQRHRSSRTCSRRSGLSVPVPEVAAGELLSR